MIKSVEKTVAITSEEELEAAEREMRNSLYEDSCASMKKMEYKGFRIEVDSEIEKSVGP